MTPGQAEQAFLGEYAKHHSNEPECLAETLQPQAQTMIRMILHIREAKQ